MSGFGITETAGCQEGKVSMLGNTRHSNGFLCQYTCPRRVPGVPPTYPLVH